MYDTLQMLCDQYEVNSYTNTLHHSTKFLRADTRLDKILSIIPLFHSSNTVLNVLLIAPSKLAFLPITIAKLSSPCFVGLDRRTH